MKVWKWRLDGLTAIEARPVPGFPNRASTGCENCSRLLFLGRDAFKTEAGALRSRKRELQKLLTRARTRVVELQGQLDEVTGVEREVRARKRGSERSGGARDEAQGSRAGALSPHPVRGP